VCHPGLRITAAKALLAYCGAFWATTGCSHPPDVPTSEPEARPERPAESPRHRSHLYEGADAPRAPEDREGPGQSSRSHRSRQGVTPLAGIPGRVSDTLRYIDKHHTAAYVLVILDTVHLLDKERPDVRRTFREIAREWGQLASGVCPRPESSGHSPNAHSRKQTACATSYPRERRGPSSTSRVRSADGLMTANDGKKGPTRVRLQQ
jgi:hypothetical protein